MIRYRHSDWLRLCLLLVLLIPPALGRQTVSPEEQYHKILLLMARQDYEQVVAECKKLIEFAPRHYFAYLNLARAAKEAKQLEPVRLWLESLLTRGSSFPMANAGIGMIFQMKGESNQAIDYYRRCLAELPDAHDPMVLLAQQYAAQKRNAEGEDYFKSLVVSAPTSAAAHFGLGYAYYINTQFGAAIVEFEQAIALNSQVPTFYYWKAVSLSAAGRDKDAIETLLLCLNLLNIYPSPDNEKWTYHLLGIAYRRTGNNTEAARCLMQALGLARDTGDLRAEENTLTQIAQLHLQQNRYDQALAAWRQAYEVSQRSGVGAMPHRHLGSIGAVHYQLGNLELARRYYEESLALSITAKDEVNQASVLRTLAQLESDENKWEAAREHYQAALDLARRRSNHRLDIEINVALSHLLRRMQQQQGAAAAAGYALDLARRADFIVGVGEALNASGAVKLQFNELPRAAESFEQALAIESARSTPRIRWQAHAGLAMVYERLGQGSQAQEHYEQAIKIIEGVRAGLSGEEQKAGYFQDKTSIYRNLAGVLVRQPDRGGEAFFQMERARARAFLDLLAEANVDLAQNLGPDLVNRQEAMKLRLTSLNTKLLMEKARASEKQNKAELARLESEFATLDQEITTWQQEARRRNPRFAALQYPEPVRLEETQKMLAPGQVMLAYALGEKESYLFAVSHDRYRVEMLAPAKVLREHAESLIAEIVNDPGEVSAWRKPAESLYQQLIPPPVARFLRLQPDVRELIIVPDGALHRVPFEVLLEPSAQSGMNGSELPFLVKRHAISYVPSATVLKNMKDERRSFSEEQKGFIAFADPKYNQVTTEKSPTVIAMLRAGAAEKQWRFDRLANSEREAKGIAGLFAKGRAELYLQEKASEENVKAPGRLRDYRTVHFSAHGLVNDNRPRFSGLILTLPRPDGDGKLPEGGEDGILSAYEIFNLKLNAELVTLSACETGLGKEIEGEGLMSLVRAFMYAGTPSVLASLWKVDDAGTADLMIDFYRFWREGIAVGKRTVRLNKAEALRHAQLKAIKDGSHPFYWAPFVLIGRSN